MVNYTDNKELRYLEMLNYQINVLSFKFVSAQQARVG